LVAMLAWHSPGHHRQLYLQVQRALKPLNPSIWPILLTPGWVIDNTKKGEAATRRDHPEDSAELERFKIYAVSK
jgi:hypothetical protein